MAISSEFSQAVQEKNTLRVRIMLKDSLLVDKSFALFSELLRYAEEQEITVWMIPDEPLEQESKPWSIDTMNYELTALVNDFTREHVNYVKQIIREVYKNELQERTISTMQPSSVKVQSGWASTFIQPVSPGHTCNDNYKAILQSIRCINKIIHANEDKRGNRRWRREDIDKIKKYAKNIEEACENIQRRR